ncbi:DUF6979 family protein [Nostoc sp. FACHB-280]|uniref:DUF6979 family protein n=1 Tax=Nostoc sp. FACHB-280 TaxID=2692839 RepID=UPI00168C0A77|nr:hypothetical protein [Nostoc sp. FACHB-280]MBD2495245.1 hypothetical protein [Nostoc sp. FACHB-280]
MSELLRLPTIPWVTQTIKKMNVHSNESPKIWKKIWRECWYETYIKLGGEREYSGTKPCPMCAAYGLWYLGRVVDSVQTCKDWEITRINHELGKNVAYAVLSLEILQQQGGNTTREVLWADVRKLYQQRLNEEAAKSEQGQIKITLALFNAKLIVFP